MAGDGPPSALAFEDDRIYRLDRAPGEVCRGGSVARCVEVAFLTTSPHRDSVSAAGGDAMARDRMVVPGEELGATEPGSAAAAVPAAVPGELAPAVPGELVKSSKLAEVPGIPERRTAPRLDKVFPVFIEGDGGAGLGVARNISDGGMFIETRDPQPLGSQVRISFPSSSGDMTAVSEVRYVCHLTGRVGDASCAPRQATVRGMGVRFLYFDADGVAPRVLH
jgi:hypothetical protein